MRFSQLNVVQRVVLSIAGPSIALVLLWPVRWIKRLELVVDGKRDGNWSFFELDGNADPRTGKYVRGIPSPD